MEEPVVVVGAGPIGFAAVLTSRLFSPGRIIVVDPAEPRRDAAKHLGADVVLDPVSADVGEVVAITTGLVDTSTTPDLLRMLTDGQLDPTPHRHAPLRAGRHARGVRRVQSIRG